MNILGVETSCDETAAAIVKNGRDVLSHVVASSLKEHKKYGGIIPEIASRRQMEWINRVVQTSLQRASLDLKDIQAVAVTQSPGLIGSLLVGLSYARALSFAIKKPLIEVDHVKAHLYANFLDLSLIEDRKKGREHKNYPIPALPAVGLVVSGGHSNLYYIKDMKYFQLLGQTRDDAAGEAFDKVARILDLGYPGGPRIDQLARKGTNRELRFSCAQLAGSFDFSFSGIKTAVLYYTQKLRGHREFNVAKTAYAFQDSVVSVLVKKSIDACLKKKVRTLIIGGGVAANSALRERLIKEAQNASFDLHIPPSYICVDNAAMIAGFGYHFLKK